VNELTDRQKIIEVLKGQMLTAREISQAVGIKEKEVLEHLPHIARSLASHGDQGPSLSVEPSKCLACGFVFRKRERLKTPSKCPVCRSEEITETRFGVFEQ
jgi:predicted Zn-ribbon and HTH transcriptional regulator